MYKMLSIRLQRSLKNRYSCRAFNVVIWAVSGCPHLPAFPHGNGVTLEILWSLCIRAVLLIKTITVQLLLQFKSLHQTRNDLQEDPITRGSQQLNSTWHHWTSVLPTCGRWQPLENTGIHCGQGYTQGKYVKKKKKTVYRLCLKRIHNTLNYNNNNDCLTAFDPGQPG